MRFVYRYIFSKRDISRERIPTKRPILTRHNQFCYSPTSPNVFAPYIVKLTNSCWSTETTPKPPTHVIYTHLWWWRYQTQAHRASSWIYYIYICTKCFGGYREEYHTSHYREIDGYVQWWRVSDWERGIPTYIQGTFEGALCQRNPKPKTTTWVRKLIYVSLIAPQIDGIAGCLCFYCIILGLLGVIVFAQQSLPVVVVLNCWMFWRTHCYTA